MRIHKIILFHKNISVKQHNVKETESNYESNTSEIISFYCHLSPSQGDFVERTYKLSIHKQRFQYLPPQRKKCVFIVKNTKFSHITQKPTFCNVEKTNLSNISKNMQYDVICE